MIYTQHFMLVWGQFTALLPERPEYRPDHPLGCRRRRISDRTVFDKMLQLLRFGCSYQALFSWVQLVRSTDNSSARRGRLGHGSVLPLRVRGCAVTVRVLRYQFHLFDALSRAGRDPLD